MRSDTERASGTCFDRFEHLLPLSRYSVGSRIICKDEVGDKFYMMKEGAVRCANIGRGDQPNKKVGYVDLGKGAHFGERALIRDELRACDVIAMKPTVCYTVGREDFVALLGNLSEAMERSLAVAVRAAKGCDIRNFEGSYLRLSFSLSFRAHILGRVIISSQVLVG